MSAARFACLKAGVRAEGLPQRPGMVSVSMPGASQSVVIGEGAWLVAGFLDGVTSPEEAFAGLREAGIPVPDVAFVNKVTQLLTRAGLVDWGRAPRPEQAPSIKAARELRHRCVSCGRSCEGQLIGPLDRPFLERAGEIHAQLSARHEDLAQLDSVIEVAEQKGAVLHWMRQRGPQKACVFLDPSSRLCRVHAELGAEAKPAMCRFFPNALVRTEDGVRGGVWGCMEGHKSWQGDAVQASVRGLSSKNLEALYTRGPDPERPHDLSAQPAQGTLAWQNKRQEERLVAKLTAPDVDLPQLWALVEELMTGHSASPWGGEEPRVGALLDELGRLLPACASRCRQEDETISGPALGPETFIGQNQRMVAALGTMAELDWPTLRPVEAAYSARVLCDWFYLRHWQDHPSLRVSAATVVIGVMVAHWSADAVEAEPAGGAAGPIPGDVVRDVFGLTLVGWMRYFQPAQRLRRLFPTPESFQTLIDRVIWER